ncbi:MAG TPA: CARDB domain-containing protein [Candidatus Thermoplasmatota archaeon]|nr:CARDB domain-containing protein [Candidatus Thermoplasmatota archaeon]
MRYRVSSLVLASALLFPALLAFAAAPVAAQGGDTDGSAPDLSVGRARIPLWSSTPGKAAFFAVDVINLGPGAATGNVVVRFVLDGAVFDEVTTASWPAYAQDTVNSKSWTVTAGHHELRVVVDPANAHAEGDETNNDIVYRFSATNGGIEDRPAPAPEVANLALETLEAELPVPVAGLEAVSDGRRYVYLFGTVPGLDAHVLRYDTWRDILKPLDATFPGVFEGESLTDLAGVWNPNEEVIHLFGGYGSTACEDLACQWTLTYTPLTDSLEMVEGAFLGKPLSGAHAVFDERSTRACPEGCAYVFGGRTDTGYQDDAVYRFNPADGKLTLTSAVMPTSAWDAYVAWDSEKHLAYVLGGTLVSYSQCITSKAMRVFNPATGSFTELTTQLPAGYSAGAGYWSPEENAMYLAGGERGCVAADPTGDVLRFDPATGVVVVAETTLDPARTRTAGAWVGDRGFLFGGARTTSGSGPLAEVVAVHPEGLKGPLRPGAEQLPELFVETLDVNPVNPAPGEAVTITVGLTNDGATAAGPFHLGVVVVRGGSVFTFDPAPVAGLAPGETKKVPFTSTPQELGEWIIGIIPDAGNAVDELDESNALYQRVTLGGSTTKPPVTTTTKAPEPKPANPITVDGPNLVAARLATDPAAPRASQLVTVAGTVENRGGAAAGPFTVRLLFAGLPIGEQQVASLAPGASVVVSGLIEGLPAAGGALRLEVDAAGAVAEATETDNILEQTLKPEAPAQPTLQGTPTNNTPAAGLVGALAALALAGLLLVGRRR